MGVVSVDGEVSELGGGTTSWIFSVTWVTVVTVLSATFCAFSATWLAAPRAFSDNDSAFCKNLAAGLGAHVIGSGCPNILAKNLVRETNHLSSGLSAIGDDTAADDDTGVWSGVTTGSEGIDTCSEGDTTGHDTGSIVLGTNTPVGIPWGISVCTADGVDCEDSIKIY